MLCVGTFWYDALRHGEAAGKLSAVEQAQQPGRGASAVRSHAERGNEENAERGNEENAERGNEESVGTREVIECVSVIPPGSYSEGSIFI